MPVHTNNSIFISYRMRMFNHALVLYRALMERNFDVFMVDDADNRELDKFLLRQIKSRTHFIVLLSPSALYQTSARQDPMRKQIEFAIRNKRNATAILMEGYELNTDFLEDKRNNTLRKLLQHEIITISPDNFEEKVTILVASRISNGEVNKNMAILEEDAEMITVIQAKISRQPATEPDQLIAERLVEADIKYHLFDEDFQQALVRAEMMTKTGEFNQAIREYSYVIQLDPTYVEAYKNRARIYWGKNEYEQAINDYTYLIQLDPTYVEGYKNRALIYSAKEEYEQAINDFDEAIRLDPDDAKIFHHRGKMYLDIGNLENAAADFDSAIKLNPTDATEYYARGNFYLKIQKFEAAISDFDKAIDLDPSYEDAYRQRGLSYYETGKYENAVMDYTYAIGLNDRSIYYRLRANAYSKLGRRSDANKDAKDAKQKSR